MKIVTIFNFMMNPYILLIIIFILIYYIPKIILKYRAYKLLKIIYRMIHFEMRNSGFYFINNETFETHGSAWNIINETNFRNKIKEELDFYKIKNREFNTVQFFHLTYKDYILYCEKFNELIIKKNTHFKTIDGFKDFVKKIKKDKFNVDDFLFENKIFDEYYLFPPTKCEVENLLKFLKKELYITDINNIELTKKAFDSLNLAEKLESSISLDKLLDKFLKHI